jgi:hypothetical protein
MTTRARLFLYRRNKVSYSILIFGRYSHGFSACLFYEFKLEFLACIYPLDKFIVVKTQLIY